MNQNFSRFCVCRSLSLLRKNLLTRWSSSSKPIYPSSSSNLIITVFISKLHHRTFSYPPIPPKIPGNHQFRKFSGKAAECSFGDDDYLKNHFEKIREEINDAECAIEFGRSVQEILDGIKVLADKFNPLMEQLGLPTLDDHGKPAGGDDDYLLHLQKYGKEIQDLVESVNETVAFAEFVAAGGDDRSDHFEENYACMLNYHEILASLKKMKIRSRLMRELIGYPSPPKIPGNHRSRKFNEGAEKSNFVNDDYIKSEIRKVRGAQWKAQDDVELAIIPPLDVVKVLADKFNALMEKLGLATLDDDESDDGYPGHLEKFKEDIEDLEYYVDMTVAFGEYVAAGGGRCWQPFMGNYRCMIKYDEILASLGQMKIRSSHMRRLIKEKSDSQSTVTQGPGC